MYFELHEPVRFKVEKVTFNAPISATYEVKVCFSICSLFHPLASSLILPFVLFDLHEPIRPQARESPSMFPPLLSEGVSSVLLSPLFSSLILPMPRPLSLPFYYSTFFSKVLTYECRVEQKRLND